MNGIGPLPLHGLPPAGGALLLSLLLLTGCLSQPLYDPAGGRSDLTAWVDAELIPYLRQTLSSHPRLRGGTFTLVRLSGDDIDPRIDALTLDLRRRIGDALMSDPGIRMAWRPSGEQRHHRRLRGADCTDLMQTGYFVGLEISREVSGDWRAAVRILDVREDAWVNGLGAVWRGPLTAAEQQALGRSREDGLLRGLRVLPFTAGQPDLAAAYFANNLSCLVRQRGLSETSLFVEPLPEAPRELGALVALLDNNLSRLHQVTVTERRGEADYLVHTELHRIDERLVQLWVALRPADSGRHIPGLDTAAYVLLERGVGSTDPASVRRAPPPRVTALRVLRPDAPGHCGGPEPGSRGVNPFPEDGGVAVDGCLRIEARAGNAGRLFLLWLGPGGGLTRLAPGRCGRSSAGEASAEVTLSGASGIGTVYALAVADGGLARRLDRHLAQLPQACDEGAGLSGDPQRVQRWSTDLDRLLAANPAGVDWTARRVRFE